VYEQITNYVNEILFGSGSVLAAWYALRQRLNNPEKNLQKLIEFLNKTELNKTDPEGLNTKYLTLDQVSRIIQHKEIKWDARSRKR